MKVLLAAILWSGLAVAQVAITLVSGASEIAIGSSYDFGKVAQGDLKDTRFRLRNAAASKLDISNIAATGLGFSIANRPSLPFPIAPGEFQDIVVRFSAGTPGSYSANLQINTGSVALLASSVAPPALAVVTGCTSSAANAIDFGRVERGQTRICNLSIRNPSTQPMAVATLAVSGAGFS